MLKHVPTREYRPTVTQLRTFVSIAEYGHFGTAATSLGISQPSLSQALVALESGLDVQLIERSTRKVIVTATGQELLTLAKATLASLDDFVAKAKGAQGGLEGGIAIGMIPTIAPYVLPEFLAKIRYQIPTLIPSVTEDKTEDLLDSLRHGKLDVALVARLDNNSGLKFEHLFTEEFVLVVPEGHRLAGRRNLKVSDIAQSELLLLDDGHCLRDQVLDLCRQTKHGGDIQNLTRATSLNTLIQLVAARQGITLVPLSAVAAEHRRPGVAFATFAGGATAAGRQMGYAFRSSSARGEDYAELGEIMKQAYYHAEHASREMLDELL
ncbi:LysR DNA-binding transcription regulator [Corynebacterium resistens DSM 45100]|uniref:Probable hydrogen peroxide-inducible genes activator n=1 Tax=Corynebacterium resistens (strain DSM 45100 / JCM 12819 / GTC 2026 / SICGH 158) TaxID=662755 RepID=F8DXY7_CORRG|nr:hydrogen peroxide-inducible genes activator [Corynebacterium resistens]AEI09545.1 LysR DNA-binding transcription regulator [Corynebacterium resistens DSM 45100]